MFSSSHKKASGLNVRKRANSTMFTSPAKRSKQGYSRSNDPPWMETKMGHHHHHRPQWQPHPPPKGLQQHHPQQTTKGASLSLPLTLYTKKIVMGLGSSAANVHQGHKRGMNSMGQLKKEGYSGQWMSKVLLMHSSQASKWTVPPHN